MSPLFSNVSTTLDLNGPTLSFVRDPIGQITNVARGKVQFTGIATATFPFDQTSRNTNTGYIKYQWYRNGNALQDNGTTIVGAATTTLSVSGLISPNDDNDQISLVVDYQPSAYQDVDSDGVIDQTGNAINDPIETNAVILSVLPVISITSQPTSKIVNEFDPDITQGVATDQSDVEATFSVAATTTNIDDPDPSVPADGKLLYSWWVEVDGVPFELSKGVPDRFFVSNPTVPTITIKKDLPGRHLVYCVVSHTTADPASIQSSKAEFEVLPSRGIISYERIGNSNQVISKGNRNLSSAGKLEFQADPEIESTVTPNLPKTPSQNTIVLYAPERDVIAKVTMGGARGEGFGESTGGNGGLSVFKMTFKKNEEYVVRLGVNDTQGFGIVGGFSEIGGGGGGMSVLYHKARVIAVCGGGGGAGGASKNRADGGDGGGIGVPGANGTGQGAGLGGQKFNTDTLPSDGNDNNGTIGGILGGCSEGNYWSTQGLTPCADIANIRTNYVDKDGNVLVDSGSIVRGYKAGQGYRTNGGDAEIAGGYQGAGGAGARGGNAAISNNSGGGGGSGYQSSEIELLVSYSLDNTGNRLLTADAERLGGNDDVGFITIEEFVEEPSGQYRIEQPQASAYSTSSIAAVVEKQVNFDVERDSGLASVMTLERIFGLGPKEISFGPITELNRESVLGENALYQFKSITPSAANYRLVNNTVQIDGDLDGIFNDLSITPNKGRFFVGQNNVLQYIADWNAPENQAKSLDRPAPSVSFSSDVDSINRHTPDFATLSWSVTGYNVTDIFIDNGGGGDVLSISNKNGTNYSGSSIVDPLNNTTYTLTAKNSGGVYSTSLDITSYDLTVNDQPPVLINSFTADDTTTNLTYNNPGTVKKVVTLRWNTSGLVKSMNITDDNGNTYPILDAGLFGIGSFNVIPPVNETTVYTLNVVNLDNISSEVKTVSVTVEKQVAVVGVITAFDGGSEISRYEHPGDSLKQITLQWDVNPNISLDANTTNDTSSIKIEGSDGSSYTNLSNAGTISTNPPKTVGSATTTTYTLTATNIDGVVTTDTAPVTVLNQLPVIIDSFTTTDTSGNSLNTYNNTGATLKQMRLNWQTTGYASNIVVTDNDGVTHGTSLGADSQITVTPPKSTQGSDSPLTAGVTDTTTYTLSATNSDNIITTKTTNIAVKNQLKNELSISLNPTSYTNPGSSNIIYGVSGDFRSFELKDTLDNVVLVSGTNSGTFSGRVATVGSGSTHSPDADTSRTYQLTAINRDRVSSVTTANLSVAQQPPVDFDQELTAASTSFFHASNSGTTLSWNVGDATDDTVSSIALQQSTNGGASFSNIQVGVGTEVTGYAVDPSPGQTIFRIRTVNTDNIVRNSDTTVDVANNPAPNVSASVNNSTITNTYAIQAGNSGATISWSMSAGSGVSSLELKQVAGSVTITNKRTGSVVFTGNHTNSSGTYNIPSSELASGQDTEFEVKGITIDDEVGTDSVTVFLKKASSMFIQITTTNPAGSVSDSGLNTLLNSTALRNDGLVNGISWRIFEDIAKYTEYITSGTGDFNVSYPVTVKKGSTTVETPTGVNATGSFSPPGSDFQSLTPGNDSSILEYTVNVTNVDGEVHTQTIKYKLKKQPKVNLSLSTPNNRVKYTNNINFIDPVTTITATVSAGDGSADIQSLTLIDDDDRFGSRVYQSPVNITSGVSNQVRPAKTPSVKYTAVATNIDGVETTEAIRIFVDQDKFTKSSYTREIDPLIATATLDNGTTVDSNIILDGDVYKTTVPYNSERLKIKFSFNIPARFTVAHIAQWKDSAYDGASRQPDHVWFNGKWNIFDIKPQSILVGRKDSIDIEYRASYFGGSGDRFTNYFYMSVLNIDNEWSGWHLVKFQVEIGPLPDPKVRYYMHGISRYFKENVGHHFTHSGNPFNKTMSAGDEGTKAAGKLEQANYFYVFHKKKRPDTIHVAPMVHIDSIDNRYAWKGPGWSEGSNTSGRLTQRPNFTTPVYEFETGARNEFSKFYTVWPIEAYNIRFINAPHWDYSKDVNGKLAPKFWVYHRNWYWHGRLSFEEGDPAPDQNTQLTYLNGTGLQGTNLWYGDIAFSGIPHRAAKCRAIGYIDLKIDADTLGAEPTVIGTDNSGNDNSTIEGRRNFVTKDVEVGDCLLRDYEDPWDDHTETLKELRDYNG